MCDALPYLVATKHSSSPSSHLLRGKEGSLPSNKCQPKKISNVWQKNYIDVKGVLAIVGWFGKYTSVWIWLVIRTMLQELFGIHRPKPLIYVWIIWFGLWACLGKQLLSHVPVRICIQICPTRVPGYMKRMWQNQNCWIQQRLAG